MYSTDGDMADSPAIFSAVDTHPFSILIIRTRCLFLVLLLILAQFLAACSREGAYVPTALPSARQVVITFACSERERQEYERLAELFHRTRSQIEVQVLSRETILGGSMRREDAIHKLATSADTFAYPGDLLPRHTRAGLVMDLALFIEADPTFEATDFYPGLLEQFQWDGGIWGLPAKVHPDLVFYDKRAFEQAGISPPRPGWTYEEFTQAAQQLTMREGDRVLRYGFIDFFPYSTIPLVLGRAGTWADESVAPPLPNLNNPALAEAVEWYTDLALKHGVMPNPTEFDEQEWITWIEGGKAAMWAFWPSATRLDLGVASLPEGKAIVDWKWAAGYAMSAGTSHPQESWEWLSFLTHQPLKTGMESVSPRRSLLEVSVPGQEFDEEVEAVYEYILNKPQVTVSANQSVVDPLLEALDSVFAGERRIDEALTEAQAQALAMVEGSAQGGAVSPIIVATPKPRDEALTVVFCPQGDSPSMLAPYLALAGEFHEQHPEITVELTVPEVWDFQHQTKVCDCFVTHSGFGTQRLLDYQDLLNLQPFLDADPDFGLNDFYPPFLEAFRREGELWGVPLEGDLQVLLYNKDLFDEVGVEYPQPGWTPEDFLEKAVALSSEEGEGKVYGYVPFGDPGTALILLGPLDVATLVDMTTQPPRPQLDNPTTVAALRWYTDLALKYDVMPSFTSKEFRQDTEQSILDQWSLVSAGRAAMWVSHPSTYYERLLPPRVGNVPLPLLGQQKMGMREHGVWGYVISIHSIYPQACWEWIKFASDHSAAVTRGLPARRSVVESPAYRSQVGEEVADALLYTVEHIDPSLDAVEREHPWLIVLVYWVIEAYDRVLEGADVEEALTDAQAKAEALVACLGGDIAAADRARYWTCAHEVDPAVELSPDLRQE